MKKLLTHNRGFTLVETILAVTIIAMVVTAAAQLTAGSLDLSGSSMRQFIAYHRAEEGVEIVRNIRDTNWLQNSNWRSGLADGTYLIEKSSIGENRFSLQAVLNNEPTLAIDEIQQRITISSPNDGSDDILHVESTVYFMGKTLRHLSIKTDLTNWKHGPL